jgi:hypothetical protein
MYTVARRDGMFTMQEDAIVKSAKGIVAFEEVGLLGGEFGEVEDVEEPKVAPTPVSSEAGESTETRQVLDLRLQSP